MKSYFQKVERAYKTKCSSCKKSNNLRVFPEFGKNGFLASAKIKCAECGVTRDTYGGAL